MATADRLVRSIVRLFYCFISLGGIDFHLESVILFLPVRQVVADLWVPGRRKSDLSKRELVFALYTFQNYVNFERKGSILDRKKSS